MADTLALQRPGHRHFVNAHSNLGGVGIVDPEIVERLTNVEIRFAGRDDTKSWPRAVDNDPIEPICAGEGESSIKLVFVEPIFLLERLVGPTDIETARRHLEITGVGDLDPL